MCDKGTVDMLTRQLALKEGEIIRLRSENYKLNEANRMLSREYKNLVERLERLGKPQ